MLLESLLRTPSSVSLVMDLQKKYLEARASLLRIRAERLRLARTGWRPQAPGETKLIRAAEWRVARAGSSAGFARDCDLEYRFVPSAESYGEFVEILAGAPNSGAGLRVRIRGLELDEPRFPVAGRPVCAGFYDLILTLAHAPTTLVVLPRVESYLEARFWAEVCRDIEAGLGKPRNSIRLQAEIATVGGIAEAEEIVFELKDSLEAVLFDPRLLVIDQLKLESPSPAWRNPEVAAAFDSLRTVTERRGALLDARPEIRSTRDEAWELPPLSIDALRETVLLAFEFLGSWFQGDARPAGRDWVDFDLMRSVVWTAIHSGFLREENYEAWKEELGVQPFEVGSIEDSALRTLDPLLRTAVFPESSMAVAFSILLDLEKTRGGIAPSVTRNLA